MTNTQLFEKLGSLLDKSEDADKRHVKKLRKVLRQLKKNQKALESSLEGIDARHERRKIAQDIEVLEMQRKKGIKVYKSLKKKMAQAETEAHQG